MHAFSLSLLLAAAFGTTAASADTSDHSLANGYQLEEACSSTSALLRSMCFGYLAAVVDDVRHDRQQGRDGEPSCLPQFTNLDRLRVAVVLHFAEHPEGLSAPSFREAKHALALAFPCR